MSNKRITDLTELTTPTTDDVFPVVDIATNTTTKVQLANLPVQTAVTTALATKQATLVSGTNIKTVNSTTLLGSGDIAVQPTLVSGTSIKTVNSNSLLGAGDVAVQPTLVSGVSIKTVNSTSLLGSGDIPIPIVTPSGVSGAIQFSNGSAFASDAANFFWDNTNKRLGVGTNAPSATGHFKGSGSTSATTSLLVQNSSALEALKITDDGTSVFKSSTGTLLQLNANGDLYAGVNNNAQMQVLGSASLIIARSPQFWFRNDSGPTGQYYANFIGGQFAIGKSTTQAVASALIEMSSTTMGFLPPRMTTTQKNAIASPAAGLVLYDSTTNKLQCYNGSTWNDLF